jgi:hypothetical protein
MSEDLARKVKQSIDVGNPRAAIALALLGAVEHVARIADAADRIAAVLERADEEGQP